MKISNGRLKHLFSEVFLLFFLSHTILSASNDVQKIKQAIIEKGADWIPGENWVSKLSPEDFKVLCGDRISPADFARGKLITLPQIKNLPSHFDWRNNNGNWVTLPKNQVSCGSCWDFAAVAQVESWWEIYHNNPDSMIDLSEQFILSCSGAGSCNGGNSDDALEFIRINGIPTEDCLPYHPNERILCSSACSNWADEAVKIPGYGFITFSEPSVDNIKNAVFRQPVCTSYMVYEDFGSYSTGVYKHVYGEIVAGHVIVIIGWDDEQQCWICKNSWGTDWGETANFKPYKPGDKNGGYFRIKWNDCDIGRYALYIWDEITTLPALAISPRYFDLKLTVGDSISQNITIANNSTKELKFFAVDCATLAGVHFQSNSTRSYDGLSWWCGNPQLGGYGDFWLQYLDLPALTLSNTTNPKLSFMGQWAIEGLILVPQSLSKYDGIDGSNVWISVDGGKYFSLAYPNKPAYNYHSLFSFGHQALWGLGEGIAGWSGKSDGWQPVELDLSPYKSDSVVIRFANASDYNNSAVNDSTFIGFFIDDILVSDQGSILFENDGNNDPAIQRSGFDGIEKTNWLDLPYGTGSVHPHDTIPFEFNIGTRTLRHGQYYGFIQFSENDTSVSASNRIQINLQLDAPDYDIAVQSVRLPSDSIPLFIPVKPRAEIKNLGQNAGTGFDVSCTLLLEGQAVYCDTNHVAKLWIEQTSFVEFKPFIARQKAKYDLVLKLLNFPNDYNSYNNQIYAATAVTNLVDNFDTNTGFWSCKGGWALTNKFIGHSGKSTMHVNGGTIPYKNKMDAKMTFLPGFHFQLGDSAIFKYWAISVTEPAQDVCYLEVSTDSLTWMKKDSLSGSIRSWVQREVSLTELIAAGNKKLWIRFHFISDVQNTDIGVIIDDVEIYREQKSAVYVAERSKMLPDEYRLLQNYPNPFNPTTTIEFSLPKPTFVTLKIYNLLGEEVTTLISEKRLDGNYKCQWDASGLASGVYLYRLHADDFVQIRKLLLAR